MAVYPALFHSHRRSMRLHEELAYRWNMSLHFSGKPPILPVQYSSDPNDLCRQQNFECIKQPNLRFSILSLRLLAKNFRHGYLFQVFFSGWDIHLPLGKLGCIKTTICFFTSSIFWVSLLSTSFRALIS